jgi:hypothetical protein
MVLNIEGKKHMAKGVPIEVAKLINVSLSK